MLTADDLRQKYMDFFVKRGHKIIPSAPLVPENDPTTLFTGSGMQPMIPYLLGADHALGTRLVDSQKCFRSQDIDEVGDNRHDSFFEMLGNWSLGDYFKQEQITWTIELLTKEIGLPETNIWFTVFAGDDIIPKDEEAATILKKNGIPENRIVFYDETKNWWSRAGIKEKMPMGEPGGPDSEIFYEFTQVKHDKKFGASCHPNCDCGRFMEIGNSVFMTYQKTESGFVPLTRRNIDFGGGLERLAAAANSDPDIFKTSLYRGIISEVEKFSGLTYSENKPAMRIVADHLKASVFLIADGVRPSNKAQGYYLRRLLRRAMVKMQELKGDITGTIEDKAYIVICDAVVKTYATTNYFRNANFEEIKSVIADEQSKFGKTLKAGLKKIGAVTPFDLYQTYGFPIEITEELYHQRKLKFDRQEFDAEVEKHQQLSRTASVGMFKGGLQDQSEITTKYHTATHILHKALRTVLGEQVTQKGSNITAERLRFDFSHDQKLSPDQITEIEQIVNSKITENLPVTRQEMPKNQALKEGALAFFVEKYPDIVSVYTIGPLDNWYSKELCGGPHVSSTGEIGGIKIIKEESAGAGIRRIYAQLYEPAIFQKEIIR
jgi:alanyl-tRNA synthetase